MCNPSLAIAIWLCITLAVASSHVCNMDIKKHADVLAPFAVVPDWVMYGGKMGKSVVYSTQLLKHREM